MGLFLEPSDRRKCPRCALVTGVKHCKSPVCNWFVCLGLSCAGPGQVLIFVDHYFFYARKGTR